MKKANALLSQDEGIRAEASEGGSTSSSIHSKPGLRGLMALAILVVTTFAGYALMLTVIRSISIGS